MLCEVLLYFCHYGDCRFFVTVSAVMLSFVMTSVDMVSVIWVLAAIQIIIFLPRVYCYAECLYALLCYADYQFFVTLSVLMLSFVLAYVIKIFVAIMIVTFFLLSVKFLYYYSKWHHALFCYADCHILCHPECLNAEICYNICHQDVCHYTDCHIFSAECRISLLLCWVSL